MTLLERLQPRPMPPKEYLGSNAFVGVFLALLNAAVIGGLVVSRANGHHVTAFQAAVIITVSAAFGSIVTWLLSFFFGLSDTVEGLVITDDADIGEAAGDHVGPRPLWTRALLTGAVTGVWGAGLGLLVFAATNRRLAGFPILFVGLLAAAGVADVVVRITGRALAIRVARSDSRTSLPRPARRRAWLELALPFALLIGIANASLSWVLFHDYAVGATFGAHILTEQQVLADLPILIALNIFIASLVCGRAGRAEAALKIVAFEDERTQVPADGAFYRRQGFVYIAVATLLVASLVRFLLPPFPNLAEAMIARGFLAAFVSFSACAFAYIRGAANATAKAALAAAAS